MTYNLVAKNYADEHGVDLVWRDELEKFINYLEGSEVILDLGCGHGDETIFLANNLPNSNIVGVDFSEEMIKLAKSKSSNAKFTCEDITLFKREEKVKGIWARASFHHLNDIELNLLFKNIQNYADSHMVLGLINKYGEKEEIEEKEKYGQIIKRYFNYFDENKIESICNEFGFKLLEQYHKSEGGHDFIISFLRKV